MRKSMNIRFMDTENSSSEQSGDVLERALLLAARVTQAFRAVGVDLVVVGGSAVEFYTEGAYMSGDIDLCRRNLAPIPLRVAQDVMAQFNAEGGPRSWKVDGLFVDLLGFLENESQQPCRTVQTPLGEVVIVPPELVLVERTLVAYYPSRNEEALATAKKMMAVCVSGKTPVDWEEVKRLSSLPSFNIAAELERLKKDVENGLD